MDVRPRCEPFGSAAEDGQPEHAGPGPGDLSSVVWLYHSHVNEQKDMDAGLVGAIPSSYLEWASEGPRTACNSCR